MKHCGSDAGESQEPGSKLETQINMIVDSIWQLNNLFNTEDQEAALNFARSLFYHFDNPALAFDSKQGIATSLE